MEVSDDWEINRQYDSRPLTAEYLRPRDCVLLLTGPCAHDRLWVVGHATLVVDNRNTTGGILSPLGSIFRA